MAETTSTAVRREIRETRETDESTEPVQPQSRRRGIVIIVVVLLVLVAAGLWWRSTFSEDTDDAQINGHLIQVSPRIGGQVIRVDVEENRLHSLIPWRTRSYKHSSSRLISTFQPSCVSNKL